LKIKAVPLVLLALLAVLEASIAWNAALTAKGAVPGSDPARRAKTLRLANAAYRWNPQAYFELGKAYFEQGNEALADPAARDALFAQAVDSFLRSLRLDPGAPGVHFHLAQTLLYLDYLSLPTPLPYFEEYRKAAALTGHNSQIFFEVGRVLLSRWEALGAGEKDLALDILRRSLAGKDEARLTAILETWNLHGRDYGLIDRIMPEDPGLLRAYARFLGEKSLALETRHAALARAEELDFARAKEELAQAQKETDYFRPAEAEAHLTASLASLDAIRFYQSLAGRELIDPAEYLDVRKKARRLLAMNRVETTRSLADQDGVIAAYLAVEEEFTAIGEFAGFLKERGLLGEGPTAATPVNDLQALAFRMVLDFRLNRYRDIVRVGDVLASSSLVISAAGRPDYVRVLDLIAEANLKLDYVYEAERFFRLARDIEPRDLSILLGIERCLNRLNDDAGAAEARRAIEGLVTPAAVDLGGRLLPKGETFRHALVADGSPRTVRVAFGPAEGGRALVAVNFNGRVVWEGYSDSGPAAFSVSPRTGENALEIVAVGGPVVLTGLAQEAVALR
jgi:hypothetical protein